MLSGSEGGSARRGMEDLEGQQTNMPIGRQLFRLGKYLSDDRKADFNGSVNGMEKAETRHHLTGEGRFEGLGRMLTVEEAGIAKEMDMDEHEEDNQAEAAADPGSYLFGHWKVRSIALWARLVNSIVHPAVNAYSMLRHSSEVVKGIYRTKRNFTCGH